MNNYYRNPTLELVPFACDQCNGTGKLPRGNHCYTCNGSGLVTEDSDKEYEDYDKEEDRDRENDED